VIGAFLNALGILLGALLGLARQSPLSARTQNYCRSALGAFTAFFGLQLVWQGVGGTFTTVLKQLLLALLAVVLGNLAGKILRFQKISNRLGRRASAWLAAAGKNPPGRPLDGFMAATILFCAAPLGILGAVTDGLSDYFQLLALKAVMDGLAMAGFVKMFRWPAALAALPVFIFLTAIAAAVRTFALPALAAHHLVDATSAAAGLVVCAVSLVVLEVRRVELANYLPALVVAPLLGWWLR
jgi:hypothetical protein